MENNQVKLKRVLGFAASYGAAVGLVVSGTAMFSVGSVAAISANATFITAAIALIPMMCTAFAYGELASMLPGGGMIHEYTAPALGKFWGTFALLAGYIVLIATDGASQLVIAGDALESMIGFSGAATSIIIICLVLLVNIFGVEFYGRAEASITIIMMVIYLILACCGFLGIGESTAGATVVESQTGLLPEGGWPTVFGAVGTAIWFFIGFEFACPMAEENKKPYRNIPLGLILGLITIYAIDIIFVTAVVKYTPLADIANSTIPHVEGATAMLGWLGGTIMSCLTILASFTTCNAYCAALPRMLYGMAKDGMVPKVFAKLHPKYRVPMHGLIATFLLIFLTLVYMLFQGGGSDLVTMMINMACVIWLVAYIIAMSDVLVLRKRYPDYPRLWKAPAAWITMPIGIIGALYAIYTMSYVVLYSVIIMVVVAAYNIIWAKAHNKPINEVVPLAEKAQGVRDRSEYLAIWDEAVVEWIAKQEK